MRRSDHTAGSAFSEHRWNHGFVRQLAPRKHLRVLPTRTRPSLFGGD